MNCCWGNGQSFTLFSYSRSWIIKISMVKCWSIPLIDSLYRYPQSIPLIDPQSTFHHTWTPRLRLDQQQQVLYLSLYFYINTPSTSRSKVADACRSAFWVILDLPQAGNQRHATPTIYPLYPRLTNILTLNMSTENYNMYLCIIIHKKSSNKTAQK